MKLLSVILCLLFLTGCASTAAKIEQAEETIETKLEAVEETVETKLEPPKTASAPALLTDEEAAAIALEHAGVSADQVTGLRISYELGDGLDDGIPEYDVEFFFDRMEYDYTIHAETGEILSFDMDD